MEINDLMTAISTVGFPIGVAAFCLYKLDHSIQTMNVTLTKIVTILDRVTTDEEKEA